MEMRKVLLTLSLWYRRTRWFDLPQPLCYAPVLSHGDVFLCSSGRDLGHLVVLVVVSLVCW